jgi:voltage-gated potassium channel
MITRFVRERSGRRFLLGGALLTAVVAAGTIGYVLIEGWSFLDALYQTLTTISTVGFREVHELSTAGRVFTMALIVVGVGSMLYTATVLVEPLIEGSVLDALGIRRHQAMIQKLRGHFVLCGAGRVGLEIAREFAAHKVPFVVIEANAAAREAVRREGYLLVEGDATDERMLVEAGVERARGLVSAVYGDAENTFITLTARALNDSLFIVSRADVPSTEARLRQAGANRVISPHSVGGRHMALSALQPGVVDFMDTLFDPDEETILAELLVEDGSELAGSELSAALAATPSVRALAIRGSSGLTIGPSGSTRLDPGIRLFVLGKEQEIEHLGAIRSTSANRSNSNRRHP